MKFLNANGTHLIKMVAFDNYLIGQSCLFEWVHCLQREYSADSNWNLAEGAFHLHLKILKLDHQTFPILLYRMDHQPVVYEIDNDKSKIFFLSIRRFWYHITCHKQLYTLFKCTKLQHRIDTLTIQFKYVWCWNLERKK